MCKRGPWVLPVLTGNDAKEMPSKIVALIKEGRSSHVEYEAWQTRSWRRTSSGYVGSSLPTVITLPSGASLAYL